MPNPWIGLNSLLNNGLNGLSFIWINPSVSPILDTVLTLLGRSKQSFTSTPFGRPSYRLTHANSRCVAELRSRT